MKTVQVLKGMGEDRETFSDVLNFSNRRFERNDNLNEFFYGRLG